MALTRSDPARVIRSLIVGTLALVVVAGLAACGATASGGTVRVLSGEGSVDGTALSGDRRVSSGEVIEASGTDAIVEIQWPDGSFTRLADGTRFEVGGGNARGLLESGTAWSAVGPSSSGYAIATDAGTVVGDPGSTFAVRCGSGCDGIAATGTLTIDDDTSVTAPATFALGGGGAGVRPAGWDVVYSDDFVLANSARDASAGFPSVEQAWADADPALASMAGTFEGPSENVVHECTGWPEECARVEANIFSNDDQTFFAFSSECPPSAPCTVTALINIDASAGGSSELSVPMVFDGTSYALSSVLNEDAYCFFDDGRTEGHWVNSITSSFTPSAAEVRNGVFVVTELATQTRSDLVLTEATSDPTCAEFEYEWANDRTSDLQLTSSTTAQSGAQVLAALDAPAVRPVTGPARPSVLSDLRTPADAIPSLGQLAVLGGGIVVIVLVLGYPAYLLSRVVSDRYDDAVLRRTGQPRQARVRPAAVRVILLVLGMIVAAIITAALDPGFGAPLAGIVANPGTFVAALTAFAGDLGSWRMVATALVSFVLFLGIGSLVVRLVGRRVAPGVAMPLQFRWGSLLILAAGVVVSRVLDITPGIIFGLVAGLVIAESIPVAGRGRLMLASALFAVVVGLGAWVGYAVVAPLAAGDPGNVVLVSSTELLSALTLEAVSALPLAFLPVAGLDGGILRRWKFLVWAIVYAVGLALFALVLFSVPGSWTEIQGDAIRWLIGFGAFTVIAITIWLIHDGLRRRSEKRAAVETSAQGEPAGLDVAAEEPPATER